MKTKVTVMLMVLGGLVFGASGAMGNLLANGDIESGWGSYPNWYSPVGWGSLYYGSDAIYNADGGSHGGIYCAALRHRANDGEGNVASVPGYDQIFSILPTDTTLHFEFWLLSSDGATLNARIREAYGSPYYAPRYFDKTGSWITSSGIVNSAGWRTGNYQGDLGSQASVYQTIRATGTDTWTKYQIDIPVLSGVTDYMVELVADISDQGINLYVDDIVVTAIPEPATLALVSLGGLGLLRRRSR